LQYFFVYDNIEIKDIIVKRGIKIEQQNKTGYICRIVGIVVAFLAIAVGIEAKFSLMYSTQCSYYIMFAIWAAGLLIFLFFYALGEIIQKLHKISEYHKKMLLTMYKDADKQGIYEGNDDKLIDELRKL